MSLRRIFVSAALAAALIGSISVVKAADAQPEGQGRRGAAGAGQRPGGPGGAGAGGFGMFGGPRDALTEAIGALGELNLSPSFSLTKEQKEKIQGIRDTAKQARDKWTSEHQEQITKLGDEFRAAMQAQERDKLRELGQQRQDLMASAPKTEDAAAQLQAVLSDDQRKQLDEQIAKRQQEMQNAAGRFGGGAPGRRGAGNNQ